MKTAASSPGIGALLVAGVAACVSPGPATAQDFARPALEPPPIPSGNSTADLNRNYRVLQARQAAAHGTKLPKGVVPDGSGNVVVLGRVSGNVVLTTPPPGKPK